jgi:hypothetical protein
MEPESLISSHIFPVTTWSSLDVSASEGTSGPTAEGKDDKVFTLTGEGAATVTVKVVYALPFVPTPCLSIRCSPGPIVAKKRTNVNQMQAVWISQLLDVDQLGPAVEINGFGGLSQLTKCVVPEYLVDKLGKQQPEQTPVDTTEQRIAASVFEGEVDRDETVSGCPRFHVE